jgi:hypothetical protein
MNCSLHHLKDTVFQKMLSGSGCEESGYAGFVFPCGLPEVCDFLKTHKIIVLSRI